MREAMDAAAVAAAEEPDKANHLEEDKDTIAAATPTGQSSYSTIFTALDQPSKPQIMR